MTSADADRWDSRYQSSQRPTAVQPPAIVLSEFVEVTASSKVLDVACGWGDAGLHCAQNGADVTFVDVSAVAIEAVEERAAALGLTVAGLARDLTTEDLPVGQWDVIICTHYLDRELLPRLVEALAPEGKLVCAIATTTNLERHERPSARFLLGTGELPTLVANGEVFHFSEDWRSNDVHEAWLVANPAGPTEFGA